MLVHQTIGGVLFRKLLQDVLISDLGEVDGNFHRLERGDGGRAEVLRAVGLASGLLDRASGYVDSFGDMLERHPDLGVDERHIGGVLSHWVEDNFLIPDVMVSFVGKRRRSASVRLIISVRIQRLEEG